MRRSEALVAVALAACVAFPPPAGAQVQARTPAERQDLIDLAYVIGRSHALRQACAGAADQYWRQRMQQLVAAEAPDPGFDRELKQSFNTGFAGAQSAFPRCTPAARREAEAAAARGEALAQDLTANVAEDDPSP